jgi:hypothetical protein
MTKVLHLRVFTFLAIAMLMVILPAAFAAPNPGGQTASAATQASSAKITQLLQGSGYNFKTATPTEWSIAFTGKALTKFNVILMTVDDIVVISVTVTQKKNMPVTTDFLMTLLKLGHSLDRVKVAVDRDGDLEVRVDLTVRVLDAQEFKANVEQVAAAANEVYAGIQASLVN